MTPALPESCVCGGRRQVKAWIPINGSEMLSSWRRRTSGRRPSSTSAISTNTTSPTSSHWKRPTSKNDSATEKYGSHSGHVFGKEGVRYAIRKNLVWFFCNHPYSGLIHMGTGPRLAAKARQARRHCHHLSASSR